MKNGRYEDDNGRIVTWYKNDLIHRDDGPAIETVVLNENNDPVGTTAHWYKEGKLHREGAPAFTSSRGDEAWYQEGKLHRTDGPATKDISYDYNVYPGIFKKETLGWYIHDKIQRDNNPAVEVIYYGSSGEVKDKGVEWYHNGQKHRIGGPAVEYQDGYQEWWQNGLMHRHDGPAIETTVGENKFFLKGVEYDFREYTKLNALSQGREAPFDLVLTLREKFFPKKENKNNLNQ